MKVIKRERIIHDVDESTYDHGDYSYCFLCAAKPKGRRQGVVYEFEGQEDQLVSMSVANDLCLTCAMALWESIKLRFKGRDLESFLRATLSINPRVEVAGARKGSVQ